MYNYIIPCRKEDKSERFLQTYFYCIQTVTSAPKIKQIWILMLAEHSQTFALLTFFSLL